MTIGGNCSTLRRTVETAHRTARTRPRASARNILILNMAYQMSVGPTSPDNINSSMEATVTLAMMGTVFGP